MHIFKISVFANLSNGVINKKIQVIVFRVEIVNVYCISLRVNIFFVIISRDVNVIQI